MASLEYIVGLLTLNIVSALPSKQQIEPAATVDPVVSLVPEHDVLVSVGAN